MVHHPQDLDRFVRAALALAAIACVAGCSHAPRPKAAPTGAVDRPGTSGRADTPRETSGDADRSEDAADRATGDSGLTDEAGPEGTAEASGERGIASYYGAEFEGRRTASGERYRGSAFTAAHRTLPFGTRVRVTNLSSGRSVEVVINDRGPHRRGRIVDLSRRAAEALGFVGAGLARVVVEVVELAAE